jgi:hypothetical protein
MRSRLLLRWCVAVLCVAATVLRGVWAGENADFVSSLAIAGDATDLYRGAEAGPNTNRLGG